MRCYFHLTKGEEIIRDDRGLEVTDMAQARAEAIKAVVEMCDENPGLASAGWTLTVADDSGIVLFTIPLSIGLTS
jgi:hypothetical protein